MASDIVYIAAAFFVVFVGVFLISQRTRRKRAEAALRNLFEPGTQFIGKDFEYIADKAGPSDFFGSMDHGREVAQWRVGHLLVEAWFQSGVCTEVEVRPSRK